MKSVGTAQDVMTRNLITVTPDKRAVDAVRQLLEHNITGVPVIDGEKQFQGFFAEKSCMGVLALVIHAEPIDGLKARDIMQTRLVTLNGDSDVFEGIAKLLYYRVSGAPVISNRGEFQGVFSERDSMSVVIASAYDQAPSSRVSAFMNPDPHRIVSLDTELESLISIFQTTYYRRLIVLEQQRVVGLISRRDVVRAAWPALQRIAEKQAAAAGTADESRLRHASADLADAFALAAAEAYMDRNASPLREDQDLLSIAQTFLNTNYRRLAVVRGRELVGLVTRKNLLSHFLKSLAVRDMTPHHPLYVSSLIDPDASIPIE